jgi:hypothetical protein
MAAMLVEMGGRKSGKLFDHLFGDCLTLDLRRSAEANGPDPFFNSLDRQYFAAKEFVLDGKAAAAPVGHARIHMHDVPERGGDKKVATGLYERDASDIVALEHFRLLDSERTVKKGIRAPIEVFKIAGEEDNPEGVAIAPFDLYFSTMDEHVR